MSGIEAELEDARQKLEIYREELHRLRHTKASSKYHVAIALGPIS
jgi:hypothetical protein